MRPDFNIAGRAISTLYKEQLPTNVIDARDYGVLPGAPCTDKLRTAMIAAIFSKSTLALPAGFLDYDDILDIDLQGYSLQMVGQGAETFLRSITPTGTRSTINIKNGSLTMIGLRIGSANAAAISEDEKDCGFILTNVNNFNLSHLWFSNIKEAALILRNCQNGLVAHTRQNDVWRDGCHITGSSKNIYVTDFVSVNGGDDVIAVVGYRPNNAQPESVIVDGFVIDGTRSARGLSCVGGKSVKWMNGIIKNPFLAGLYIASEASYDTYGVEDVSATNIDIVGAGRNSAGKTNAAVHIVGRTGFDVNNVTLENVKARDSAWRALTIYGEASKNVSNVTLKNVLLDNTTDPMNKNGAGVGIAAEVGIDLQNVHNFRMDAQCVVKSTGSQGLVAAPNCSGRLDIVGHFEDINRNGAPSCNVVHVPSASQTDAITIDITHGGQVKPVWKLVQCQNPQTVVVRAQTAGGISSTTPVSV